MGDDDHVELVSEVVDGVDGDEGAHVVDVFVAAQRLPLRPANKTNKTKQHEKDKEHYYK